MNVEIPVVSVFVRPGDKREAPEPSFHARRRRMKEAAARTCASSGSEYNAICATNLFQCSGVQLRRFAGLLRHSPHWQRQT